MVAKRQVEESVTSFVTRQKKWVREIPSSETKAHEIKITATLIYSRFEYPCNTKTKHPEISQFSNEELIHMHMRIKPQLSKLPILFSQDYTYLYLIIKISSILI